MRLRDIILAATAVTAFSSTFAANTGLLAQGGTYVGLAGGWGKITTDSNAIDYLNKESGLEDNRIKSSGGFAGRVYFGYLTPAKGAWLFGPEVGYSFYPNNIYSGVHAVLPPVEIDFKQSAYGIDFLLNATYMLTNTLNLAMKPGLQYAFETYNCNPQAWDTTQTSATQIRPEINVEMNWQAFADKPFFIGASYQQVFGNGTDNLSKYDDPETIRASSRKMFAVNLEYLF